VIVGTAGHIDHGKTALVRALTGVDTDRLPEERRRGITIELGFAPLVLEGAGTAGVVDVPGHEAFVRTMLAGATGIDLALLVVAADEGVMPQTREHVAILSLLGVRAGVVALTKCDLVDDADWLALVEDDLRGVLRGSPLATAPVIPTSAVSGAGLDELRAALAAAARALPARDAGDLFRMPVDRSFSVRGTGTVVTGTVWSGEVARDAVVRVLPGDRTARVRGLHTHGAAVDAAQPAARAALALAGLEPGDVPRGATLVTDASWRATRLLRAEVALLADAPAPLRARTRVRLHLGTMETGARVVVAGGGLAPGERRSARVVLDEPVVARAGDRFVLRSASPVATVGGGTVTDPLPPHRRARPWPREGATAEGRLRLALAEAAGHGVPRAELPVRLGIPAADVAQLLARAPGTLELGSRVYDVDAAESVGHRLKAHVEEGHRRAPLEPGVSLQAARAALGAAPELVEHTVAGLVQAGVLVTEGGLVRLADWAPRLDDGERALAERLVDALAAAGREPPSVTELAAAHGGAVAPLLRFMERKGRVAQVEPERYYAAAALEQLIGALRDGMVPGRVYGPGELRELVGVSRKYLIPFLEYCDRRRVTERRADGRVVGPG
jgi:selenocysteine-specific elongation factor